MITMATNDTDHEDHDNGHDDHDNFPQDDDQNDRDDDYGDHDDHRSVSKIHARSFATPTTITTMWTTMIT